MEIRNLIFELTCLDSIEERRLIIASDLKSGVLRFKILASSEPFIFFQLLGGEKETLEPTHSWASKYTYEDYLGNNPEISFSVEDEKNWDIQEKSIEQAYETGVWYDTCSVALAVKDGSKLFFLFDFCEGFLNDCLACPYEMGSEDFTFGYLMDNS